MNCSDANQSLNMTPMTNISSVSQQETKRKAEDIGPRTSFKVQRTTDKPKVVCFSFDTTVPSLKDFNLKIIALNNCQNYGELRKSKNGKGFFIKSIFIKSYNQDNHPEQSYRSLPQQQSATEHHDHQRLKAKLFDH